jgi:hypothetical protein
MATASQVALNRIKVKVVKKEADGRNSLCGEPMQEKLNSKKVMEQFFIIPAHLGEYVKKTFPGYDVSQEFEMPTAKVEEPAK